MLLVPWFTISNHVKEKRNLKAHKQEVHQTYFAHTLEIFSFLKYSSKPSFNDAQVLPLSSFIGIGKTGNSNGVSSHLSRHFLHSHCHA